VAGAALTVGEWDVDPVSGQISRNGQVVRIDARLMRLLVCLAARAGQVVSTEDLLAEVWSGVVVTQDSVYQAVASLRRVLGDDSRQPAYVATVPRRGYRLVARVVGVAGTSVSGGAAGVASSASGAASALGAAAASGAAGAAAASGAAGAAAASGAAGAAGASSAAAASDAADASGAGDAFAAGAPARTAEPNARAPARRWRLATLLAIGAVLCLAQAASVDPGPAAPPRSVAVLPFLDLTTESMDQEFFADGLTEELIDDLSQIPDLRVPSATAAFYFKGKQMTVAHIARELGVAYIVDGSLRKSGSTFRVAARLVRADNGFVVWSRTFDRQSDDVLKVQGEVATEITRELQSTLHALTR